MKCINQCKATLYPNILFYCLIYKFNTNSICVIQLLLLIPTENKIQRKVRPYNVFYSQTLNYCNMHCAKRKYIFFIFKYQTASAVLCSGM